MPTPIHTMSTPAHDHGDLEGQGSRSNLSAAADGQADAIDKACDAWRDDPSARATWHTYHLIGDVLRSSELAVPPRRDEAFLQALRVRLAAQPAVLAPAPLPTTRLRTPAWFMPAAVAAGFVVVAGVLVVARVSAPPAPQSLVATVSQPGVTPVSLGTAPPGVPGQGALLRNPRLDEFLRAHQAARGGIAVAVPGSALQRAAVEMPAGAQR